MTAGQGGGPHGEPTGQPQQPGQGGPPQGWNAPPSPPPYGQQYPGYAPAPSAPTGYGAPEPLERPTTVRAGIGALVASMVLGLISAIVTFSDLDGLIAEAMRQSTDPAITEDILRTGLVVGVVIGLILVALEVLFLWFAWKGYNWARIVIWVLGGISVAFGLVGLAAGGGGQAAGFNTSLGWFQLLLTAAGIVLLALKPSNEWYRFRSWQRATGQG